MSELVEVPPLSRAKIRAIAQKIRTINYELTGMDAPYFPIVEFLDNTLPKHFEDFVLEVVDECDLVSAMAYTLPDADVMQVRADVYQGAIAGNGRDRLTLAHELGHYVLHSGLGLARTVKGGEVPKFRQSEWQADAFGGELLVSARCISGCSDPTDFVGRFGVSHQAAKVQWSAFERDGLIGPQSMKKG